MGQQGGWGGRESLSWALCLSQSRSCGQAWSWQPGHRGVGHQGNWSLVGPQDCSLGRQRVLTPEATSTLISGVSTWLFPAVKGRLQAHSRHTTLPEVGVTVQPHWKTRLSLFLEEATRMEPVALGSKPKAWGLWVGVGERIKD